LATASHHEYKQIEQKKKDMGINEAEEKMKRKKMKRQEPEFEYTKETIRAQPKSDTLPNFPNTDTKRNCN